LNNREIELTFLNVPPRIRVDEELTLDCLINNRSERELELSMRLNGEKSYGYLWNCSLTHEVGKVPARSSTTIKLNIVPTQTGLLVGI
jgi:hypothetical protein